MHMVGVSIYFQIWFTYRQKWQLTRFFSMQLPWKT